MGDKRLKEREELSEEEKRKRVQGGYSAKSLRGAKQIELDSTVASAEVVFLMCQCTYIQDNTHYNTHRACYVMIPTPRHASLCNCLNYFLPGKITPVSHQVEVISSSRNLLQDLQINSIENIL